MTGQAPERIGKYHVDGVLGRGAMGVVYRGHDPDIERVVAIKTVHAELVEECRAENADWLERFSREAKAAGRVMHTNLVTVFDYLVQDGAPYLVMEYIEAETLQDRIRRGPLPSLSEIASILRQMLEGLAAVHGEGIVHRDVKPANVMLLPDGRVKMTDFGVARVESLASTQAGMVGTPSYMAPEQFKGLPCDERADIFACGVILFELVTGQKPYPAKALAELSQQVIAGKFQRLAPLVPNLPQGIDALLERSLAPEPADRFANATEFAEAVTRTLRAPSAQAADLADDRTVIAPPPGGRLAQGTGSGTGLSQTMLDQIPASVFGKIERTLIEQFGPIGRVWLRRAAASTHDVDRMIERVAEQIADPTDRDTFRAELRRQLEGGTGTGTGAGGGIREELLREMASLLSPHVGPIAAVLVKRTAAKVSSEEELRTTLAGHISDETERAAFLRSVA
ncbi:MAG: serine/threonine-protein kinase [Pseudomonadota bacterium]